MKKMGFLMGMFGVMLAFVLVLSGCAGMSWSRFGNNPGTITVRGAYRGDWLNEGVLIIPDPWVTRDSLGYTSYEKIGVIGADSFKDINLIAVVIPNSVTTIRERAFSNNSITSVTIPGNVNIGAEAFDNNFTEYYNGQAGRSVGTYTYDGSTWRREGYSTNQYSSAHSLTEARAMVTEMKADGTPAGDILVKLDLHRAAGVLKLSDDEYQQLREEILGGEI